MDIVYATEITDVDFHQTARRVDDMTVDHPEEEKCFAQDDLEKPYQEEEGDHSSWPYQEEEGVHSFWTFNFEDLCLSSCLSCFRDTLPTCWGYFPVSENKPTPSQESQKKPDQIKDVTRGEPFSPPRIFQFFLQFDYRFCISTISKWAFLFLGLFCLLPMSNASYCSQRNGTCNVLRDKGNSSSCKEECIGVRCLMLTTDEQVSWVENLQNCPDLHEMYLAGSNITYVPWGPHLENLHHVHVTQTSISKLDVDGQTCESITKIVVKDNPISDISDILPSFPNLKEADFSNNNITKIPPINREQNKDLCLLDLRNNKLEDLNFKYYSENPRLVFNLTVKDSVITIYNANDTKTVINITGNSETISCQVNKVEFDPSITVSGNFSCVNEDGSPDMVVLPFQKDTASGILPAGKVALIILAVVAVVFVLIAVYLGSRLKK